MFGLLAKLAEILNALLDRGLSGRRASRDAEIAFPLIDVVIELQDVLVRGRSILRIATEISGGTVNEESEFKFREDVRAQAVALKEMRSHLAELQPLLATFDSGLALELLVFSDEKSGLIARWSQQAAKSSRSSLTMFFLAQPSIDRVVALNAQGALLDAASDARATLVMTLGDELAAEREHEARDFALMTTAALNSELARAASELVRASEACASISKILQSSLGEAQLLALRRQIAVRES